MKKVGVLVLLFLAGGLLASVAFAAPKNQVRVYYFYTDYRCARCYKFELYTKKAMETYFSNEIADGEVVYQAVNTDKKENKHFLQDYQLFTKSTVVSLVKDGKEVHYKNLDKIWQLVGDEQQFVEYIKGETDAYLAEMRQ
jgi:hypothetical protein